MKKLAGMLLVFIAVMSLNPVFACQACVTKNYPAISPLVLLIVTILIWLGAYINCKKTIYILAASVLISLFPLFLSLHSLSEFDKAKYSVFFPSLFILLYFGVSAFTFFTSLVKEQKYRMYLYSLTMLILVSTFGWCIYQADWVIGVSNHFLICYHNVNELTEAVYNFREKNGKCPESLNELKPDYINEIPSCYKGSFSKKTQDYYHKLYGIDLSGYHYAVSPDRQSFVVYCPGYNHRGPNEPANGYGDIKSLLPNDEPREK
ncbi:MAG: hypothetical protein LWY06_14045 [Firmicutes bacterium]|nr:hypothetical protein [Bacillota bacterium]